MFTGGLVTHVWEMASAQEINFRSVQSVLKSPDNNLNLSSNKVGSILRSKGQYDSLSNHQPNAKYHPAQFVVLNSMVTRSSQCKTRFLFSE